MPNVEDPELISFLQAFANETLPNLRTTKAQAFLLVLSFIVAAGLSWSQVDGLLNLINALFGCDVLPGQNTCSESSGIWRRESFSSFIIIAAHVQATWGWDHSVQTKKHFLARYAAKATA